MENLTDWTSLEMRSRKRAVLNIEGYIGIPESWQHDPDYAEKVISTKEKMRAEIEKITGLNVKEIEVNIDSFGGSVNHGLSIYNALVNNKAKVIVNYTGWSASIATVIAAAGDEVNAPDNFFGLLHEAQGGAYGTKGTFKEYTDWLGKVNETIAKIYSVKGGQDSSVYVEIMSNNGGEGRWISAEEMKEIGLIDNVQDSLRAAASAEELQEKAKIFGLTFNNKDMFNSKKTKQVSSIQLGELTAIFDGDLDAGTALAGVGAEIENGVYDVNDQKITVENSVVKSIETIETPSFSEEEVQNRVNSAVETITAERDTAVQEREEIQNKFDELQEKYNNLKNLSSGHKPKKKEGVSNDTSDEDDQSLKMRVKEDVKEITEGYRKSFEEKRNK